MRNLPVLKLDLSKPEAFGNLAAKLGQEERRILATDLIELIGIDHTSMGEWLGEAQGFLDKLDADHPDAQPQNREQEGADEEQPPSTELTLTAVVQFAARATDALLGEPDLARASEPGGEKLAEWVSSQLRTTDPNWTLDTDPLIVHMAVTGLAWRKRSFDDVDRAFHSYFCPCTSIIINKNVRSIERAPRITEDFERYPYEIERSIARGHWIDYEPKFTEQDTQAPKKFYECDLWLDLDDDGMDEPWTITISRDDFTEVVKISPRWSRKTIVQTKDVLFFKPIRRFYPYRFLPDPKGGFLPMGFGRLLSRVESSADNLLAAIVDTAQSAAQDGGIAAGGAFGLPDKLELKTNRVNVIPTDGRPLSDAFQAFPTKQVSAGSVQVLEKIMTLGDRLAGTLNALENAPASMTATLAKGLIDSGSQVQSAVHRRLVSSMTQEFRMFVQMADAYNMLPEGVSAVDGGGVAVTADPQLATEMARTAMGGIYMEMLKTPVVFNPQVTGLAFLQTMRVPNPEQFIAAPQTPQATPDEKMKGYLGMLKHHNDKIKATGQAAVQFTQAFRNMVDASGGMIDQRTALLQMAQLEQLVKSMVEDAGDAGTGLDGMAPQSGNPAISSGTPQPGSAGNTEVSGGQPGGPPAPGAGGGLS